MKNIFILTAAALMLSIAACAQNVDFDWTLHAPEEVGMTAEGLETLREAIQKHIDDKKIAGAVTAVVKDNKLVWYEAQGQSDPIAGRAMKKDDVFRMMSSSKAITATAVLILLDEGKLSIDDKVSKYIPSFTNPKVAVFPEDFPTFSNLPKDREKAIAAFMQMMIEAEAKADQITSVPAEREITIKDLLTHTSGLSGSLGAYVNKNNKIERRECDRLADYIPRLGNAVLDFNPGTKWSYSALDGIDVLGYIVEVVSGQPFDAFLKEHLFDPLEMNDTWFFVPEDQRERVLNPYEYKDGMWSEKPSMFGYGSDTYFCGAGGLFSTVHDFMNWEVMLLNKGTFNGKRILKPETVELMCRNHVGNLFADSGFVRDKPGLGFGLGVRVVTEAQPDKGRGQDSFGWGGAYGTESWVEPELNAAVVMFIQADPAPSEPNEDFGLALRRAIETK